MIDDQKLPEGTRLIVRREPLHPGAQRSLFPSLEFRYWGFYTDADGNARSSWTPPCVPTPTSKPTSGRLKDSGLCRMPFTSFEANANWMMTVAIAADLVRWFQLLCFDGHLGRCPAEGLRWGVFHAPGRLIHRARQRVVRIIDGWPGTDALLTAYRRIELIS